MAEYARPVIAARTFHDAEGRTIPYGDRWGGGSPAEDSYSVTSNLDRFAPLHDVADALVDHLHRTYAVSLHEGIEHVRDLMDPAAAEVVKAVRVVPVDPGAAPLTFVYTAFPGIRLHAGFLPDFTFPSCGCDACDETWERSADELESAVHAVTHGGFSEGYHAGAQLPVWFRLVYPGGSGSGATRAEDYPPERFAAVADALRRGRTWSPWPLRA